MRATRSLPLLLRDFSTEYSMRQPEDTPYQHLYRASDPLQVLAVSPLLHTHHIGCTGKSEKRSS